jgi:spermidine synthase (EC 2.5.1.16)
MGHLKERIEMRDGSLWLTEEDRGNLKISYRLKEIVFSEQSPFQHIMIADSYDFGRMLVLDGVVQTTARDGFIYNEMITHVPLHLHPDPRRVLIIGGGDCGAAREVAKYSKVERIDLVEIDERVVKACFAHLKEIAGEAPDPRIHFFFADGIEFVKNKENIYDVIIVDSSDPEGFAENLFSRPFYENLHRALRDGGIMVCQSESPFFQQEFLKETAGLIRSLFWGAKTYIATVPTYPGGFWSFTIGKKGGAVNPEQIYGEKVETRYFNKSNLPSYFSLPAFMESFLKKE